MSRTALADRGFQSPTRCACCCLPDRVKDALERGEITEGHARALLGLPSAVDQIAMLETVLKRGLSVRETESAVRNWVERLNAVKAAAPPTTAHRDLSMSIRNND